MLKLYWYCLDMSEADQRFVAERLDELEQLLKKPQAEIELRAIPLSPHVVPLMDSELHKPPQTTEYPFLAYYLEISKILPRSECIPLLIYCKVCSSVAQAAREECNQAKWGYCRTGRICAVYKPRNKYILWHEVLHLFGAEDCHEGPQKPGPICKQNDCIMQYAPTENNVCPWPFLCKENIERIQAWDEKQKRD